MQWSTEQVGERTGRQTVWRGSVSPAAFADETVRLEPRLSGTHPEPVRRSDLAHQEDRGCPCLLTSVCVQRQGTRFELDAVEVPCTLHDVSAYFVAKDFGATMSEDIIALLQACVLDVPAPCRRR